MKKLNLIFLTLCACCVAANAQITGGGDDGFGQKSATKKTVQSSGNGGKTIQVKTKSYNYELSVGPRAGIGFSSMSEGDGLNIYDGSGIAFDGGIAANVRFGGKDSRGRALDGQGLFGVGLELNYKNMSVKTKPGDKLKLGYFEVPILLQLYPCYNTKQLKNLYIEFGATVAGTLSKSPDNIKYSNTVHETDGYTTHDLYEQWNYPTGEIKGFDIKPTFGVGYRFNKNSANDGFYASLRYSLGTSKLAKDFPGKMSCAELTVGYLFKCIGTKKSK